MSYNYEKAFSLDWNGKIFVMTNRYSDTSGNILYSHDAVKWTSVNPANLDNIDPLSVKWIGQKYILDTSNTLFNSIDGIHWVNSSDISNTFIYDIETNLEQVNTITFPKNTSLALGQSTTSTIGIFDNSDNHWDFSNNSISVFSNSCNDAVWNGKMWIAVGNGTNSIATSVDGKTWIGRGSFILSSGNTIQWNRETSIIVAGGVNGIAYSYDGIYWKLNPIFSICTSVECNGSLWVATGSNSTSNTIAYSYDGIQWNYSDNCFNILSNKVIWNGSFWTIIGENTIGNNIATSYDGIHWSFSTILNGLQLANIIYNSLEQNTFIADSSNHLYETKTNDYSNLSMITTNVSTIIYNGNYYLFGKENLLKYSPDMDYTFLYNSSFLSNSSFSLQQFAWNYPNIGYSTILPMTIAVGSGPNTIGYSYDGIQWYGNGSSIFTNRGNRVIWNGSLWCAVGAGSNGWVFTSFDGISWKSRNSNLMTESNDIAWNGKYFIAVGSNAAGLGIIAISYDGFQWTSIQNTLFTNITKVVWTGYVWIIYGFGSTNVATSKDGFYWTTLNKTIESFSSHICPIVTNRYFFLQSNDTLSQYDLNCNFIQDISSVFVKYITSTCFDGENYIAFDMSSNVYRLTDHSIDFQSIDISCNMTNIFDSTYNEKIVIIGGIDPSGCIAYNKMNFSNKFNSSFSNIFTSVNGISSNSGFGFVHTPNAIYLNPNEKLSIVTPKYYTNSIIPPTNITMNIYANENTMI